MFGIEFGIGTLLTLLTFLRSEVGGRHTKEDLLRIMGESDKAEQFREWLRQQDQADLIREVESSKSDLLSELASLGGRLDQFASEVLRISGDLQQRFHDLDTHIRPPVLSLLSLPTRPRASTAIKGRERELNWLIESTGDLVVSGQPGSGKTELLQSVAPEQEARFLITSNPDEAAAALTASCPPIVIVDDAGTKRDVILRLRHLRSQQGANFRIIAICWPFDKAALQRTLQVNDAATLNLEGLPRNIIAEIINDIAAAQGVTVNDEFIRVVAKQARGMPGLAAALSLATITATGEALVSGELLLRDLTPYLLSVAGPHTVRLLGAFACGGKRGISVASVAQVLGMNILQVTVDAERVALAGVLEQTGKDALCVQPAFLRSALLKETFFPSDRLALPWEVCEELITSAEDPVLGYLELIQARGRAAAVIPIDRLREIARRLNDRRLWDAIAALDEVNCEWVIKFAPALSPGIKRAALHYVPSQIIPALLGAAVGETRPLNAFPDADMRLIEEWIGVGWSDAVERRRILFDTAISWLKGGGNTDTALSAVRLSFGLNHHESDSDPADPRTIRFRDALLSLNAARTVFKQWDTLLRELNTMDVVPWSGVTAIADNWLHTDTRRGGRIPDDYADFLLASTMQMIGDLLPLASDNQAALRWIDLRAQKLGMLIIPSPVAQEFMILFPNEPLDGDWEEMQREYTRAAQELAVRWKERPIRKIVEDLSMWEKEAEAVGRVWPQMVSVFTAKLAEIKVLMSEELSLVIRNLSARASGPFVETAILQGRMAPEHFQESLDRSELHGILIHQTLVGRTPDLYESLRPHMPRWEPLIESLCMRGEVTEEMLNRLLQHEDNKLRREVALHIFRAEQGVPPSLGNSWRSVVVQSLIELANGDDANDPYDLDEILAFDPSIGPAVLDGTLSSGTQIHGAFSERLTWQLIAPLSKEERKRLLHRCTHLVYSPLPRLLVGHDEDLYRESLSIPELKGSWQHALIGDPNEGNWTTLAKIALAAGYSHAAISLAVNSGGYSWNGGLSTYYQQWVERFVKLQQHPDIDMQRIADEGIKWSKAQRDAERQSEKNEEIHGGD